ncbi:MAG: hypothetical protein Q4B54_06365 [Coriobacteriales bacterium]|nr:hypothetical protein [Coriobacteriales bacterium]
MSVSQQAGRFGWQLALVDALPVAFFGAGAALIGYKLQSALFFCGALVCVAAGLGKVVWKLLIALANRDVRLLGAQLRYLMPAGFVLMIAGALTANRTVSGALLDSALRLPAAAFFVLCVAGLCAMVVCAKRFDRYDVRGNWIEQGINALAQGCFLLGVICLG